MKHAISTGLLGMEGTAVEAGSVVVEYPCPVDLFGGGHSR